MPPAAATQLLEIVQRMEERQIESARIIGRLDERTKHLDVARIARLEQQTEDLARSFSTDKRHTLIRTLVTQALTVVTAIAGAHFTIPFS